MGKECPTRCECFKSKSSAYDELRYQYMIWVKNKNKENWELFVEQCKEQLSLPKEVSMDWLRGLTGR